ncbi:MAG TPA: hypothetical protein ENK99_06960, partial [Campylobacterales bacterium]|nr:hypothetical protein [Campylobacterales bacterium]
MSNEKTGDRSIMFDFFPNRRCSHAQMIQKHLAEIEKQKNEITNKNIQITDSINYASRIQKALLPHDNLFENYLANHFIYFKPRDIVSGDFYW